MLPAFSLCPGTSTRLPALPRLSQPGSHQRYTNNKFLANANNNNNKTSKHATCMLMLKVTLFFIDKEKGRYFAGYVLCLPP